ncbi:uncharacterized protein LOC123865744 [Maniola jurtina]|uniref:uncharacterized protein LOC123865744 n=1 Tax=Maniola jurtina TaxID=191418 RepID=UPI001E68ED54|nr:uncharacterized protein LOC123865744 [Maniola jurtina]
MAKLLVTGILLVVGVAAWVSAQAPSIPQLDPNEWWGPSDKKGTVDTSIRPFQVTFPEEMIEDLKDRLLNHRKPAPPLEGIGFQYGFNSNELPTWVDYWANEYNFTQREEYFNQFPHYKTNIQGLDIHFIWIKPQVPDGITVVPLLLLHGRPGSVREFYDVIPVLSQPYEGYKFVFELIVPSLPAFGFSDAPARPGVAPPQIAVIFKNLMARLGHDKFYIQGGDWGSIIGSAISTLYPNNVLGYHSNLLLVQNSCTETKTLIRTMVASLQVTSSEAAKIKNLTNTIEETGYIHEQATKPETLGASLSDSAVGFLAYMLEKFSTGTKLEHRNEADGGLSYRFSKDELLDNIMVYWSTNTITTSMRIYAEFFSNKNRIFAIDEYPTPVPTWSIQAKNEFLGMTKSKLKYPNLLDVTLLDDGGHFLAFELPQLFVKDVFRGMKMAKLWSLALVITATAWHSNALPQLDHDEWWGPQDLLTDATQLQSRRSIKPFKVQFGQEMIDDLRRRLQNRRSFVAPLEGTTFDYGFNPNQIDTWANYWANDYDFAERESFMNQFPQYKTNVQGLDIHFIRVKPEVPEGMTSVPLLLLHGWPGSVLEFYEAIPLLTNPTDGYDFVFEVIVPSLPGYGFSDGAVRPGMGPAQIAVILKNLMKKLGHNQFYIQGGDWGSVIGRAMATLFQDDILGYHSTALTVLNSCAELRNLLGGYIAMLQVEIKQFNRTALTNIGEETGYVHLQATKPDSVGISLSDSPVGLMTWILEKFSTWTRSDNRFLADGGLFNTFTQEQLIDNIMVYWITNSMTTAMRLYAEYFSNSHRALDIDEYPTKVPVWNVQAPFDLFPQPLNKMKFLNVQGITVLTEGGHFLAFELPEAYSADVFKAVKAFIDFQEARTDL